MQSPFQREREKTETKTVFKKVSKIRKEHSIELLLASLKHETVKFQFLVFRQSRGKRVGNTPETEIPIIQKSERLNITQTFFLKNDFSRHERS